MGTVNVQRSLLEFGERVRDLRKSKSLSQESFASMCGFHRTYIGTVERGERNPALLNMLRISKALDVDISVLVRGLTVSEE